MSLRRLLEVLIVACAGTWAGAASADIDVCADAAEHGQVLRDEHKLLAARAKFVTCAQRECPTVIRDSCTGWLTEIDRALPSIVVSAKTSEGRDVSGARVTLDGAAVSSTIATSLDPGPHTLRVEATGFVPAEEQIVMREGETRRVFRIVLTQTMSQAEGPRTLSPWVYGLAGLGIVGLGTFAIAAATGASEYDRLERECSPRCASGDLDALSTRFFVADVGLVVGVLALGGAAALAFFGRPSARTTAGAASAARSY